MWDNVDPYGDFKKIIENDRVQPSTYAATWGCEPALAAKHHKAFFF